MIAIKVPLYFLPEIEYVVSVIFGEFLKVDYQLENKPAKDYEIVLDNKRSLVIRNTFFPRFKQDSSYLNKDNIPHKVEFLANKFTAGQDIPVIYGSDEIKVLPGKIICGIDIFASVFFMLSRWEEYVIKSRDSHGRFPAAASLSYKNNFLHRPVVNEYIEMLKNMLTFLGLKDKWQKSESRIVPTHDVDFLTYPFFIKRAAGDIVKRRNLKKALQRLKYISRLENPYLSFDFLMDLSEGRSLKSRFYFTHQGKYKYDGNYAANSRVLLNCVQQIKTRGHIIGFHPSYHTHNNAELFAKEKQALEQQFAVTIKEGRHHYLRFAVPDTWQNWEEQNMHIDSTAGYPDHEGFRCGTGNEFSTFNILTGKKLRLKERPLILMDTTLNIHRNLSPRESLGIIKKYRDTSQQFGMPFTILIHNSSFDEVEWQGWREIYEELMKSKYNE